jgi:hypothetical protein
MSLIFEVGGTYLSCSIFQEQLLHVEESFPLLCLLANLDESVPDILKITVVISSTATSFVPTSAPDPQDLYVFGPPRSESVLFICIWILLSTSKKN